MGEMVVPSTLRVPELVRCLEDEISFGQLPVGAWLKQADLERRFGCSRILLREALSRLEEKGLVALEANRGYRVRELDEQRLHQILQVRGILEGEAMLQICGHAEDLDFENLRSLAEKFEGAVKNGTVIDQEQTNRNFHAALLRSCPNCELVAMIFELRNRAPVSQNRRKNTYARLVRAAEEHFKLLTLIENQDAQGAQKLVVEHVVGV